MKNILTMSTAFLAAMIVIALSVANRHAVRLALNPFRPDDDVLSVHFPFFAYLLGALMELKGGYKMTPVFYRGSAPAINDLLAGTIDMVPDYLLANKGNIDAGKIKMIAVADHHRLKEYPNVATMEETERSACLRGLLRREPNGSVVWCPSFHGVRLGSQEHRCAEHFARA